MPPQCAHTTTTTTPMSLTGTPYSSVCVKLSIYFSLNYILLIYNIYICISLYVYFYLYLSIRSTCIRSTCGWSESMDNSFKSSLEYTPYPQVYSYTTPIHTYIHAYSSLSSLLNVCDVYTTQPLLFLSLNCLYLPIHLPLIYIFSHHLSIHLSTPIYRLL